MIPHYVLDYESRFRDKVMEDFADSYLRSETPIPYLRCKQTVKFTDLLTTARDLGTVCLATGHYVQRVETPDGPVLRSGIDASKDQSCFLFTTTAEQIDYLRFPLGGLMMPLIQKIFLAVVGFRARRWLVVTDSLYNGYLNIYIGVLS